VTIQDFLYLAQLIALVAAAIFFAIKLAQGWLIVNLSLDAAVQRTTVSPTEDALAVRITVTKGAIGSLRVKEALVRVPASLDEQIKPLVGAQVSTLISTETAGWTVRGPRRGHARTDFLPVNRRSRPWGFASPVGACAQSMPS